MKSRRVNGKSKNGTKRNLEYISKSKFFKHINHYKSKKRGNWMENTELVIFNKEDIPTLVSNFDIKTKKENNKTFVINNEGEIECCASCKRKLETKKIGSIAHGSRLIFCDNPLCLSGWVAKNKV